MPPSTFRLLIFYIPSVLMNLIEAIIDFTIIFQKTLLNLLQLIEVFYTNTLMDFAAS